MNAKYHSSLTLLTTSLLFCMNAMAGPDAGYYQAEQLPKAHIPLELTRGLGATVRLSEDLDPHCTGALISTDGYVLTAGHCLSSCLLASGDATELSDSDLHYKIIRFDHQRPNVTCPRIRILELQSSAPRVVYVGRGFSEFDDERLLDFPDPILKQMISLQDDFAILKFDFPNNPPPCIPMGKSLKMHSGDPIWTIGFPSPTQRSNQRGSDGISKYISFGMIYPDLSKNQYYREAHFNPALLARAQSFYSNGNQILSNLDTVGGNSGSPVLNQNGELIGVTAAGAIGDPQEVASRYFDGTSVSVSLDSIRQELSQNLGKEQTSQLFRCGQP